MLLMYNPKTRYVIMSRDIRWADFNRPQPHDGLDMHRIGEEDDGDDVMFEHQYHDSDESYPLPHPPWQSSGHLHHKAAGPPGYLSGL